MDRQIELWLFVGFELASFLGALVLYFRSAWRERRARQRFTRGVRIIVAYGVLVFFYYGAGFGLNSYPVGGIFFYGGGIATLHVMLLAAVFIFAGIILSPRVG